MRKATLISLLLLVSKLFAQNITKDIEMMKNVKYAYNKDRPFVRYDSKKPLDYLEYFKAKNDETSLLVFYMLTNDSIKIVNGGKVISENRFVRGNSTSVRSIEPISNQKNLELIFYKKNGPEKVVITAEELKKYKFIYVSPKESPLHIEFTNSWKLFM